MKVKKMKIRTTEVNEKLKVVRAMLEFYPIDTDMLLEKKLDDETQFSFHMDMRDLDLLDHDIDLMRLCGYTIRKARS